MAESAVVYATDANYWPHLYVSLYSLLKNNPGRRFRVFIICDREDAAFRQNLPALPGNFTDISFILAGGQFDDAPTTDALTEAAYYRLLIARLIPGSISTLLYLDCDTVVTKPIDELLDMNLPGTLFAAAPMQWNWRKHRDRLSLPPEAAYFNTGVMLIDMTQWRESNVEGLCAGFIKTKRHRILFADQDVLNSLFHDRMTIISNRFNFDAGKGEPDGAAIIHYAGKFKPWPLSSRSLSSAYWRHRQGTPYRVTVAYRLKAAAWLRQGRALFRPTSPPQL